jgi:S1-C subfamily serine protease
MSPFRIGIVVISVILLAAGQSRPADEGPQGYVGIQIPLNGPVIISDVFAASPAAKAGLRGGDLLVKVANVEAKDGKTVIATVMLFRPGDKIAIDLVRDGKAQQILVVVSERPRGLPIAR